MMLATSWRGATSDRRRRRPAPACLLGLVLGCVVAAVTPAEAHYREPLLKLTASDDSPTLGASKTFEVSDRGDQIRAVANITAPPSFRAGSGVTTAMNVAITVSSAKGGTAHAKLVVNWGSGIAMLRTPDSDKGPTEPIIATAEVAVPKGGTATCALTAGVRFSPIGGWDEENRCVTYTVSPAGGRWDAEMSGLANPQYHAFMHTYSEGAVGLGGSYDLQITMGAADVIEHLNYRYEGKAEYYDETAVVAPPPAPVVAQPRPAPADDRARYQAAAEADAARAADLERYAKFFGKLIKADMDLQDDTLKLRLLGQATEGLRAQIRKLKKALDDPSLYQVAREDTAEAIQALEGKLATLLKAQDGLIAWTLKRYRALLEDAGVGNHNAISSYTREGYDRYRRELEARLERMELELYFSAGQQEKFDAIGREMIARHTQPAYVYRLRAADYISRGQPQAAFYALHRGLAIAPDDWESRALLWQLEDGYLRALAARAAGRPAEIRARLEAAFGGHGAPGWFGALRDVLTTGITTSVSAIGGKADSLTDLAVTATDEAVVEHAGLQLILSLRAQGLSLQDISNLNQDRLWVLLLDRYHIDPTKYNKHDDLLRMRKAIHLALQNQDVRRLMAPTREQFDIETNNVTDDGLSRSWQDQIGDAANVANTMMLLGPNAVIGAPGRAARVIRGTAVELPEAYTLSDGLALALRLDDVAVALGKTTAGRTVLKELLLFDKNAGEISKLIAQTMVKQGLVQGAEQLGGQPAKVAMQVLTALGLGDMKAAARLLRSQGLNEGNIEALLAGLQKSTAATLKVRVPLADTVKTVQQAAKPTVKIAPQQSDALRATARQLDARAQETAKIAAQAPANSPAIAELNQQRLAQNALLEAAEGRPASANASLTLLNDLEQRAAAQAQATAQQLAVGEKLAAELKALPPIPAAKPAGFAMATDAKGPAEAAAAPPGPPAYTGLIVDCRGQHVQRAQFPQIVDSAGASLFGEITSQELQSRSLVTEGRVGYYSSVDAARRSDRAGAKPLLVTAVGSSGPFGADQSYAVVSVEDGRVILAEGARGGFLANWNVCFVVD